VEKIFIDTDDLRDVARHTKGAVHQLSDIKLDVLKAAPVLQNDPATAQAFQGVLAALDAVGTAINGDYDALVNEVVGLEAEQGVDPLVTAAAIAAAPAPAVPPPAPGAKGGGLANFILLINVWPKFVVTGTPSPAPEPWNKGWVNADGSVPPGQSTMSNKVEWGESWEARVETKVSGSSGIFTGSASAGASVDADVGAEAEFGETEDGYGAKASAHAHAGASAHAEAEGSAGPIHGKAHANADASLDAEAHAGISVGKDGVNANIGASAKAEASASAGADVDAGPAHAGVDVNAKAEAHAEAHAEGHAGTDGVSGSYGAGAGASATAGAEAHAGVDGVGEAHYGVKAGVGVGVHAGGSGSLKTDDIGFDFNAELGLGIDLGIDFGIHINPEGILDSAWKGITDPIGTVGDAVDTVVDTVEAPFKAVADTFAPSHDAPAAAAAAAPDMHMAPPVEQGGLFGGPGPGGTPPPADVGVGASAGVDLPVPDVGVGASAGVNVPPPHVGVGASAGVNVPPHAGIGVGASASAGAIVPAPHGGIGVGASASGPAGPLPTEVPGYQSGGLFGGPGPGSPPPVPHLPAGDFAVSHVGHVGSAGHLGSAAPIGSDLGVNFGAPHAGAGHIGGAFQVDGVGSSHVAISTGDGAFGATPSHQAQIGGAYESGGGAAGNTGGGAHDFSGASHDVAQATGGEHAQPHHHHHRPDD
jgi:hypothetical protein